MGGYAAYVWSAFGIALLLLVGLFVQSRHAARRREAELAQLRSRDPSAAGQGGAADAAPARGRSGRARPPRRQLTPFNEWPSMRLRKQQRLALVVLALLLVGGATGLVLTALNDKVAFFVTPSDVAKHNVSAGKRFRLGGLVVDGSIQRQADGTVRFAVTDKAQEVRGGLQGAAARSVPRRTGRRDPGRAAGRTASSRRARCWPSTTRTTCPRKSPTR